MAAWTSSPLPPPLAEEARRLIERLDAPQRFWLSGYLAGIGHACSSPQQSAVEPAEASVTLLYGSQSGNAEGLARKFAAVLGRHAVPCKLLDMIDCGKPELLAAKTVLVVVSTQGEGDPPDRAVPLWELLNSRKAPQLSHLRYAVLGLGDSSYQQFCEMGRRFDARLEALGAERLHPRGDCDVDFESVAGAWIEAVTGKLAVPGSGAPLAVSAAIDRSPAVAVAYTRKNPFHANVLVNQRLTAAGSTKDVRHIELSLGGSNIHYEPGDAIGIVPRNDPDNVDELLRALPFDPESPVTPGPDAMSLRESLLEHYDIGPVNRLLVERYGATLGAASLIDKLALQETGSLPQPISGWDLLDLVRAHPPENLDAQAFIQSLRPLAPRLYSIASSLRATPDEAHLTVGVVEYETRGRKQRGVVSGMLASLGTEDSTVPIYLHRNAGFRLPAPDVPIVMIGPGTGVAPFRAFLAERAALGAPGRNWLFFGDRSFETDFLYQADWLTWRKQGVLTRIEVAFSRDQEAKVYVQQRLREHGAELWDWLTAGAYVYVCGDAQHMAPDVHSALLEIAQRHGALSEDRAVEYFAQLTRDRRYQKDVY